MPEGLSDADVLKVAKLARLAIPEERIEPLRRELAAVLGYVERLRSLDLSGVEPMAHVGEATNRFDEDVPGATLPNDVLMKMAPDTMEPFIKVPKVLGEGSA